jgi:hypothetical protein
MGVVVCPVCKKPPVNPIRVGVMLVCQSCEKQRRVKG